VWRVFTRGERRGEKMARDLTVFAE
jgi:hypothetical protein